MMSDTDELESGNSDEVAVVIFCNEGPTLAFSLSTFAVSLSFAVPLATSLSLDQGFYCTSPLDLAIHQHEQRLSLWRGLSRIVALPLLALHHERQAGR